MGQYLPIISLLVLAVLFAGISFIASGLLAPTKTTQAKRSPYECGIVPNQEPPQRFPVRFYLVAMIFIVFDIEIIFLYPWATIYRDLGVTGLVEMLIFAVAVFGAFVYLIANGALDWGPVKRLGRVDPMVSAERTARTTVRRVGQDGRESDPAPEVEAA